ncbi:hypothetical protein E0W68_00980 [Flavobacterium salilacus subsp. salilacus]|uniref:hypothetical protein n=1 Tax=Flavobacterium TaxID=237 RepID=UPI001074AC8D|nr:MULTISPECIES: hypothetical protein [Flavobacterium]KAF2519836.1 hypothetical protein E0W68_00980 [Flavobacterium salilacus subsp. salilacus]MBE1614265.1 hypothetical protein [Flavobacterium sp. SaA2.13]
MKKISLIFLLFVLCFSVKAQNLYLKVEGSTVAETKVIDSISYNKVHQDAKSIMEEAALLSETLLRAGYLENREIAHRKVNDSVFNYIFSIGQKTNTIRIYTDKLSDFHKQLLNITQDTITLSIAETESFMNNNMALLEKKGYSLSNLQLINLEKKDAVLTASLTTTIEKKRTLDGLVLEGYKKFPEGIRRSILRKYRGKTFNRENLQRVYNDFNAIRFINQVRYPEILFKEDTTKVYVYLEKAKPNTFDGYIGFSNDENEGNVRFNGYLDLLLINILNSGERFNLYWKNNGDEQTTFNTSLELPYIFKSPIGIKASLNIFKQDSTFQTTVTDLNVGYYFNYNSRVYLGYKQTESVDIQNLDNSTLSDYSSTFYTSTYEYTGYSFDDFLFPEKTSVFLKGGFGARDTKTSSTDQYFIQTDVSHNLYLNKRNIINLKNESFYLSSSSYIINELFRFGGINSIRGFNENSLQASLYTALMAEYRYVVAPNLYVYSITDYGYFQDKTSGLNDNLLGLGFGFGLFTNNGLFNIVYANGSTKDDNIKLSNSIVHLSFKTRF